MCRAREIVSMIISDVPGNHLPDIGSGLTAEDPTSYQDAVDILKRRDQWQETPLRVREHLRKGVRGAISETPKPGSASFQRVHNLIIADNEVACKAAERSFEERKIGCTILSTSAELGARDMGKLLAAFATKMRPSSQIYMPRGAILIGGECSVQVTGKGKGGRNQVVALSAVEEIEGLEGTVIAALGTDGIDGNSRAAGAIVDGNTARRAKRRKLDPSRFLARDDSGTFFRRLGDSLVTRSTGTNVGDIYLMISL
jgi:glycerate-2-kinase